MILLRRFGLLFCLFAVLAAGPAGAKIRVAASTTFVAECVAAIGGDAVEVTPIFPREADPHAYEPSPRDLAKLEGVAAIFENGLGLEESLSGPLKMIKAERIDTSRGIAARTLEGEADPHVWFDPVAILSWTTNIEVALSRLDPANAGGFRSRAEKLRVELRELDSWIREQVAIIPTQRRVIVTDHDELGYFTARYGFKMVGAILPGFSTLAEPSARDVAALEKIVRAEKAPAVFTSGSIAPALARRVAADTGAKIIPLPGCALGAAGSDTGTLAGYLRALTARIVEALR